MWLAPLFTLVAFAAATVGAMMYMKQRSMRADEVSYSYVAQEEGPVGSINRTVKKKKNELHVA